MTDVETNHNYCHHQFDRLHSIRTRNVQLIFPKKLFSGFWAMTGKGQFTGTK